MAEFRFTHWGVVNNNGSQLSNELFIDRNEALRAARTIRGHVVGVYWPTSTEVIPFHVNIPDKSADRKPAYWGIMKDGEPKCYFESEEKARRLAREGEVVVPMFYDEPEDGSVLPSGAWIVYNNSDHNAYPIALFETEIEALRHSQTSCHGYGQVKFWEFGTEWGQ